MPPAAKRLWATVFNTSEDLWVPFLDDYYEDDARLTANVAVHGWYEKTWRRRPMRGIRRLPDVGNLFNCGCFTRLTAVRENGELVVDQFAASDKIPLWWSEDLKACIIMPFLEVSACIYTPTRREDRLSKVWAKGRPARCARLFDTIHPPLPEKLPGIAIDYVSDKFAAQKGKKTYYIHHFEMPKRRTNPGVYCYYARPLPGHKAPSAIMVRGGDLRLTEHGLAG